MELGGGIHEANDRDSRAETRVVDLLKLHFFENGDNGVCDVRNHLVRDRRIHETEVHIAALRAEAVIARAVDVNQRSTELLMVVEAVDQASDQLLSTHQPGVSSGPSLVERAGREQFFGCQNRLARQFVGEGLGEGREAGDRSDGVIVQHVFLHLIVLQHEETADIAVVRHEASDLRVARGTQATLQLRRSDDHLDEVVQVVHRHLGVLVGHLILQQRSDHRVQNVLQHLRTLPAVQIDGVLDRRRQTADVESEQRQVLDFLVHEVERIVEIAASDRHHHFIAVQRGDIVVVAEVAERVGPSVLRRVELASKLAEPRAVPVSSAVSRLGFVSRAVQALVVHSIELPQRDDFPRLLAVRVEEPDPVLHGVGALGEKQRDIDLFAGVRDGGARLEEKEGNERNRDRHEDRNHFQTVRAVDRSRGLDGQLRGRHVSVGEGGQRGERLHRSGALGDGQRQGLRLRLRLGKWQGNGLRWRGKWLRNGLRLWDGLRLRKWLRRKWLGKWLGLRLGKWNGLGLSDRLGQRN